MLNIWPALNVLLPTLLVHATIVVVLYWSRSWRRHEVPGCQGPLACGIISPLRFDVSPWRVAAAWPMSPPIQLYRCRRAMIGWRQS